MGKTYKTVESIFFCKKQVCEIQEVSEKERNPIQEDSRNDFVFMSVQTGISIGEGISKYSEERIKKHDELMSTSQSNKW